MGANTKQEGKGRPWEKNIRRVEPYIPGEQPDMTGMIKLNTNENPYPPAPSVERAMKALEGERLRLYPNPDARPFVTALEDYYHLKAGQVFVGVGSDDVLAMSFLTFFNGGKPILFPDITYSFYKVWAELFQIPYVRPAVDGDFHIKREDYYRENGGIVLANPNAPTSIDEGLPFIRDILDHNRDVIVIVDEAYVDFGAVSAMELIEEYDNLLVVQTFSKSRSMAGMRIGFAAGNPVLIKALNSVKNSYNSYTLNLPSIMAGTKVLEEEDYFRQTVDKIITEREAAKKELKTLGFSFPDSKTNFIFASHRSIAAKELFLALRKKHIFVRYFNVPGVDNYLRITIGTKEEMETVLTALKEEIKCREGNTIGGIPC